MLLRIFAVTLAGIAMSIASAVLWPIWLLAQSVEVSRVLPARCAVGQITFKPDVTPGSNLFFCTSPNVWTQMAGVAGGEEGGGASGGGINPFWATRDSSTQVTLGPDCSSSTPCVFRVGNTTSAVVTPGTVSSPSGSGTVRLGVSPDGMLAAWHNLTGLSCGGSLAGACVGSTGSWPPNSVPLAECIVSSGVFDAAGCADVRPFLSRDVYSAGSGLTLTNNVFSLGAGALPNYAGAETPAGTIDGANRVFSLAQLPITGSLQLFRNGLIQKEGLHFTVSDQTVTFAETATPETNDVLIAYYRY